jgi:uncharacterized membrane protein YdjX (TVP38/TMEM64 family)
MKNIFMKFCAFFFRRLANANYKYEQLKEPKRFYVAMGVGMLPFIILHAFGLITDNKGLDVLGILWIFLIVGIRMWAVLGNLKDWKTQ